MFELRQPPATSEFDAAAVGEAVDDAAGDGLRTFVEYDEQTYELLYARDDVVGELGGPEGLSEIAEQLHADYRLDFTQQELYEEMYGSLGEVTAFAVVLESASVLRFVGESEGVYVSLDRDVSMQAVLDAVEAVMDGE
ncbi:MULTISPECIES: hypothetical protein [Halobacterium]|uniref:hypothetical protein n=1 Tax=Halobacterium TaxID=2239 RepID=UPI00073F89A3|nr:MULTISPECIES: hypothetical protein [Halobacterium]MCG1002995.1 hypothetical protein [Halobacterium noricense]